MNSPVFNFLESEKIFYNVNCKILELKNKELHSLACHISPGDKSTIHNHHETEIFIFISGQGLVHLNDSKYQVTSGTGIKAAAFENHIIENTHASEPLVFISLYWEDLLKLDVSTPVHPKRSLVFSTPPTPNGDLHLGHLSGPYLSADIYKRYLHYTNHNAIHITGRDDNQTYVVTKSIDLKQEPQKTADQFSNAILKTLAAYHVSLDYYIEPNNSEYRDFIQTKFNHLYEQGIIYAREELALYDKQGKYLHEAYIRAACPSCLQPCDGNACEACGKMNSCTNLAELDVINTTQKSCKRLYFKLSYFTDKLQEYILSADINAHTKTLALNLIAEGLDDICVSHPSSWGLPCTVSGFEDHIIYVWFEMAFGYLYAASKVAPASIVDLNAKFEWFYNNKEAEIVHFYGYDNSFYHTLLFPAVYLALGLNNLPKAHIVNELLNLDGKKFSTSRNHLIYGRQLSTELSIDHIRWYLCKVRPEGVRTNFVLEQAKIEIDQYFNNKLNPLRKQIFNLLNTYFSDEIPEPGAWTSEHQAYFKELKTFFESAHFNYQRGSFSPAKIIQLLEAFVVITEMFLHGQLYYFGPEGTRSQARTSVALLSLALKTIAELSLPITPKIGNQMLLELNQHPNQIATQVNFIVKEKVAA